MAECFSVEVFDFWGATVGHIGTSYMLQQEASDTQQRKYEQYKLSRLFVSTNIQYQYKGYHQFDY